MATKSPLILLVEDEVLVQVLVFEILEERGYKVCSACSAQEALDILHHHCSDFDLLLTDINLGCGENGLELARKARALCPGIQVIYVTGGAHSLDLDDRVPGSRLIPKPFELEQICAAVAQALPAPPIVGAA